MLTGTVIQQVHVSSSRGNLSCNSIALSSNQLFIYTTCQAESLGSSVGTLVFATDLQLRFNILPEGYTESADTIYVEEFIRFQKFALPVTYSQTTIAATGEFQYSTGETTPIPATSIPPSRLPTRQPTSAPSGEPSNSPTFAPSISPQPTSQPSTGGPTNTYKPTLNPSIYPTNKPRNSPTQTPFISPSCTSTISPTAQPSCKPTTIPTSIPSSSGTGLPSQQPTKRPTRNPSAILSRKPTSAPSVSATVAVGATVVSSDGNGGNAEHAMLIFGYVVAALVAAWCIYRLLQLYMLNRQRKKLKSVIRTEVLVTEGRPLELLTNTSTTGHEKSHKYGAYSNQSEDSSSIAISSLHSSELSDISYSFYSQEDSISYESSQSHYSASISASADSYLSNAFDLSTNHSSEFSNNYDMEISNNSSAKFSLDSNFSIL